MPDTMTNEAVDLKPCARADLLTAITELTWYIRHADVVREHLPEHLREFRKANKITLGAMSRAMGFSKVYISDVERGKRPISLGFLAALEGAMSITFREKNR